MPLDELKNIEQEQPVIHIVDDDVKLLESLSDLFEMEDYMVHIYDRSRDFLSTEVGLYPGCVILDLRMPEDSGLTVQDRLNDLQCPIPVVFLTGHGDVDAAVSAFRGGAVDFLKKTESTQEILETVKKSLKRSYQLVLRGRTLRTLSERETDVADLLVSGRSNKIIASDLDISEKTVDFHRRRIMKKLGITHVSQLHDLLCGC